jgi:hypothetical protein
MAPLQKHKRCGQFRWTVMKPEIFKKSGYRIESTDGIITIKSSRRPKELIFVCFLTLWIGFSVFHARLSDNLLMLTVQYIIFLVLVVGPFLLLYFQWTRKVEIQSGRVRITGTIKGEIDNSKVLTIDTKTEQSTLKEKVTVLLSDSDNGLSKLFVVYVKTKDMGELDDFVDQIRRTIGLKVISS